MKLEGRGHRKRGEPVIALINVVFLILIFVMVTTVIEPLEPLVIDLAEGTADLDDAKTIELVIAADGRIAFEQEVTELDRLLARLEERDIQAVTLRADAGLTAGALFGIVTALQTHGIQEVDLATSRP